MAGTDRARPRRRRGGGGPRCGLETLKARMDVRAGEAVRLWPQTFTGYVRADVARTDDAFFRMRVSGEEVPTKGLKQRRQQPKLVPVAAAAEQHSVGLLSTQQHRQPPPPQHTQQQAPLTREEIAHFKRDGYLIKRNVLDPVLCARARDVLWEQNLLPRFKRDEPSTWRGPFGYGEEDTNAYHAEAAPDSGGTRRTYRWHGHLPAGGDTLFVDLVGGPTFTWAEQLLGEGETTAPRPPNGIHCTLPRGQVAGANRRRRYTCEKDAKLAEVGPTLACRSCAPTVMRGPTGTF
jgi:hypothetical protein